MPVPAEGTWLNRLLWLALAAGTVGFVVSGCAHRETRTEEVSADEHRRQAARESALADAERARFDPSARASSPIQVENLPMLGEYNPTEGHLRLAAAHATHARAHQAAAEELERFEDAACKPLPPSVRAACPVIGPMAAIEDIDGGVRLRPVDGGQLDRTVALMRCHLAYARTRGFATVPDCPLYMRGVEIRASADGRWIELTAPEGPALRELRDRVHALAVQSSATVL
jgi:hypothetical protein